MDIHLTERKNQICIHDFSVNFPTVSNLRFSSKTQSILYTKLKMGTNENKCLSSHNNMCWVKEKRFFSLDNIRIKKLSLLKNIAHDSILKANILKYQSR